MCDVKYKGIDGLEDILKAFDTERKRYQDNKRKLTDKGIGKIFKEQCADKILRGYFLVNDEYILDVKSIELYYHEENGSIKDHIMYHTCEHYPNDKVRVGDNGLSYFELGTLNFHQSGVDITFEKKDEYRASFLIREYRIFKKTESLSNNKGEYDIHSTHIFDDVFYLGIPVCEKLDIKWKSCDEFKDKNIVSMKRYHVAKFRPSKKDSSKFEKDDDIPVGADTSNEDLYIKAGKGKYYKQCPRLWRFRRVD